MVEWRDWRRAQVLGLSLLVAGCSTPYQSRGLRGGYSSEKLAVGQRYIHRVKNTHYVLVSEPSDESRFLVRFFGNAFTPKAAVVKYLRRRSEELCWKDGYKTFSSAGKTHRSGIVIGSYGAAAFVHCKQRVRARPWVPHPSSVRQSPRPFRGKDAPDCVEESRRECILNECNRDNKMDLQCTRRCMARTDILEGCEGHAPE